MTDPTIEVNTTIKPVPGQGFTEDVRAFEAFGGTVIFDRSCVYLYTNEKTVEGMNVLKRSVQYVLQGFLTGRWLISVFQHDGKLILINTDRYGSSDFYETIFLDENLQEVTPNYTTEIKLIWPNSFFSIKGPLT